MGKVSERKLHYDVLRVLAAFSVVLLHSAAQFWYELDIRSVEWVVANSYDALFRFGVPIFVMISGAIFLDPNYELNIKRLYTHNVLRMVGIYVLWSMAYGVYDYFKWYSHLGSIKLLFKEMLYGRYHLWFLPMIAGIYVLLPILKNWIDNTRQKTIEYFLLLFLVVKVISETIRALTINDELHYMLDIVKVEMAGGYIGYFVLGYYLAHIGIGPKVKKILYGMLLPSAVLNAGLSLWMSWRINDRNALIYDSFGAFTFLISVTLFVFACDKIKKIEFGPKSSKLLKELSEDTLGVYVLHIGFMEITMDMGFHSMTLPNVIQIPLYALVCYLICTIISAMGRWLLRAIKK